MKTPIKLWVCLGILILLTPLGLLAKGAAWGEWASEELAAQIGFIPDGLKRLETFWKAAFPGYTVLGWGESWQGSVGYILSALVGVGVIVLLTLALGKCLLSRKRKSHHEP